MCWTLTRFKPYGYFFSFLSETKYSLDLFPMNKYFIRKTDNVCLRGCSSKENWESMVYMLIDTRRLKPDIY